MKVIELLQISKRYKLIHERKMPAKTILLCWLKNKKQEDLWALKDINLAAEKGEAIGIIGENGSGKTTLLKILSGVTPPTSGTLEMKGRVFSILELGAGFHPDLTGKENIYLNGSILGISRKEIDEKFEEIVEFSGLREFIDVPLRNYSSGMYLRLGFSVAISLSADILLIDEVLSVGDEAFQRECFRKIKEIKNSGKTIVFVSHDLDAILNLCDRVFLLHHGEILQSGKPAEVVQFYLDTIGKKGVAILKKFPQDIIFNQGRISLYWQGKKITKDLGGFSQLLLSQGWYNSNQAQWEVTKENENKLVAIGKFNQLPLRQLWKLELLDDNIINWQIELELEEPFAIPSVYVNIMLANEYTRWFTTFEKGNFSAIEDKTNTRQTLSEANSFSKYIGVGEDNISEISIPALVFEQACKDYRLQAWVCNSDYAVNCRILQYKSSYLHNCLGEKNRLIIFSGKIILNIPDTRYYLKKLQDECRLENGESGLVFDNGRGILSYNGINITKLQHLFYSVFVNAKWYLSYLAYWEVERIERNKIVARGKWHNLPIIQVWEIETVDKSSFLFKFYLQVNEEVNIEEQQIKCICSWDYRHWFTRYETGNFPDGFFDGEIDILQKCIQSGPLGLIGQERKLPKLSLKFTEETDTFAKVFDASYHHDKVRMLKITKISNEKGRRFLPGYYKCFTAEIILSETEEVLARENF